MLWALVTVCMRVGIMFIVSVRVRRRALSIVLQGWWRKYPQSPRWTRMGTGTHWWRGWRAHDVRPELRNIQTILLHDDKIQQFD